MTENGQNIGGVPITLGYSGTGAPTGLGPVTTVSGAGASFSSLTASSPAQGTLSVTLPITAAGNSVQPATLTASASLNVRSTVQTIAFVAPSTETYGNAPVTLTATGGASGNPVTFSLDPTSTPGSATLSGSTLTILSVGTVVIDAHQAAGGGYTAAAQVQQSIVINPAALTITASSPNLTYGSAVPTITPIFGAFFNGDTSAVLTKQPTCITAYTTASAASSSPSTSCSGAMAANYAFTYVNGSVTVNKAALAITASSPTVTYGSAVPTIAPIFGNFFNGDTSGVLTKQPTCVTAYTTTSTAGSVLSTSCSGATAANYVFTYVNGSVTVNKATATLAIAPSSSSISTAQALTVTVAVRGGSSANPPTGSVMLISGSYTSGALTLSNGTATIGIAAGSLAVRIDTLTVSFTPDVAGSANYNGASGTSTVSVTVPPTFVVSGGSSSISIVPGATTGNTVPITVTPANGFTGTVDLTCSVSPVAANDPVTCSLSPASVAITGPGSQTSTLTISTTASTVAQRQLKSILLPAAGTALALVLMIRVPRRRQWPMVLGVLAVLIACGAIGCGGGGAGSGSGKGGGNSGTTPGNYSVSVTGTSGGVVGSLGTITLTVQ